VSTHRDQLGDRCTLILERCGRQIEMDSILIRFLFGTERKMMRNPVSSVGTRSTRRRRSRRHPNGALRPKNAERAGSFASKATEMSREVIVASFEKA